MDGQQVGFGFRRGAAVSWMLAALFFCASIASAQIPGLDYLGGAKYCDEILRNHPNGAAAGFFIDTFGDVTPCIERLIRSGKTSLFRIHLGWSDTHVFRPSEFDRLAAKAAKLEQIIRRNPGAKILVSAACEHNLDATQAKILRAKTLAKCPSCFGYVNTPWRGALIDHLNEVHGQKPRKPGTRYLVSYDGVPAVDSDVTSWKQNFKDAEIQFLWEPRFNGRWEDNDKTPRPQRKGWPDDKLIRSVSFLNSDRGGVGSFPKGWIWKSHSENHGKGDSRAEKPVAIIGAKTKEISLVTTNGKLVSKARYYGPFEKGLHRYYFPSWGYELAERARAVSGSPLTFLRVGRRNYGPINPGFRHGVFR